MSPSEQVRIYIPDHLRHVVDLDAPAGIESLSNRIAAIIDRYGAMTAECPGFRQVEWLLILDACNGWASWTEAGETIMVGLTMEVADHIRLNRAGEKWGLPREQAAAVVKRLADMTVTERMAIVERFERFWRRSDLPDEPAMMLAGIHPTDRPEMAYELVGMDAVRRVWPPRFLLPMDPQPDGSWTGIKPSWLDPPPECETPDARRAPDAAEIARLMREAGEAFAVMWRAVDAAR